MPELQPWSVTAVNLPEHGENPIHTDAGAIAAGFPGALVAGATVYAYLTHVPTAAWGLEWLSGGGAEVRFSSPVMNGALVDCVPIDGVVEARVDAVVKARCTLTHTAPALESGRANGWNRSNSSPTNRGPITESVRATTHDLRVATTWCTRRHGCASPTSSSTNNS